MAKTIYKKKGNFKGFLFVFGLLIIAIILIYTQHLVNILQQKSREYLSFRIKIFEQNINNPDTDNDLNFFFTEVIQGTDFPIIYTDADMQPQIWKNMGASIDTVQNPTSVLEAKLKNYLADMDSENPPIPIEYQGIVLGYYHYGVSPVIKKLRWLPYIEIAAAVLFIFIGYVGFSQIKKSEERYIWVGMAKETAHQLGTPISSLNGWVEVLKDNPQKLADALNEIATDAIRLNKVASRFSQIGSVPQLEPTDISVIIQNAVVYLKKRLPQFGKSISILETYNVKTKINLNGELFEWVIENIIKNAIDAIESKHGTITILLEKSADRKFITLDISDSGKGISPRDKNNIFKPGFSTKRRGWGLGLSLAKRIIEDYHGGKLFLKESRLGHGSTIRLLLRVKNPSPDET